MSDQLSDLILTTFQRADIYLSQVLDLRCNSHIDVLAQIQAQHERYAILFNADFMQSDHSLAVRQYLIRYNRLDAVMHFTVQLQPYWILVIHPHKLHQAVLLMSDSLNPKLGTLENMLRLYQQYCVPLRADIEVSSPVCYASQFETMQYGEVSSRTAYLISLAEIYRQDYMICPEHYLNKEIKFK